MSGINLSQLRTEDYDEQECRSGFPCLFCGRDVTKIEDEFMAKSDAIFAHDEKAVAWYKRNFIHMSTDGYLYFVDEDVAEGEESQGCFPIGSKCMKRYKQLRAMLTTE